MACMVTFLSVVLTLLIVYQGGYRTLDTTMGLVRLRSVRLQVLIVPTAAYFVVHLFQSETFSYSLTVSKVTEILILTLNEMLLSVGAQSLLSFPSISFFVIFLLLLLFYGCDCTMQQQKPNMLSSLSISFLLVLLCTVVTVCLQNVFLVFYRKNKRKRREKRLR